MTPLRLFLMPPVRAALRARYQDYRRHRAGALASGLMTFWVALAWLVLRLESPAWQPVRAHPRHWFPHIAPHKPRLLDGLRYLLQAGWLLLTLPGRQVRTPRERRLVPAYTRWRQRMLARLNQLPAQMGAASLARKAQRRIGRMPPLLRRVLYVTTCAVALVLAWFCISQPFGLFAQFTFVLLLWGIAMLVRNIPGRLPTLMLIVLSLTVSCRYLWWRYTQTLNWDDSLSLIFGLTLLVAETYAWVVLVLGYFQTIWPLNRKPAPMPEDISTWPHVDVMVPTYNEDLSVVRSTLYAALGMDWPKEKLEVWLLDDGNRPAFRAFAEEIGVRYVARPTHEHAKAGNINNALKQATGDLVAIFDCDHVPTRSFLQMTVGWFFKDKKLSIVQTPHHFFSPDPFERNLGRFRQAPNEGALFYGLVQDGNDLWDATFFCGSCAVIRRNVLNEIGGIAVETVTEDAHTSLRMHRHGYTSAYIRIPQAAGLATESLSSHIRQRIRWARGMVQIFRLDNPLFGKGLKLSQRLCYVNAMMHFLAGVPRLIFLLAPLAFLLFHAYIIYAPALAIVLYVFPHMVHASLTNSRIQGKFRHSFWSEIYETVLAWYIARPTTVALFRPHGGVFDVTAKGGLVEESYVDWKISQPYRVLMLLNLLGLIFAFWRFGWGLPDERFTVLVSVGWVIYNMIILGGATAVAFEAKQVRQAHRVEITLPAALMRPDGHMFACTLRDYSEGGVGVEVEDAAEHFRAGESVQLLLRRGDQEFIFPCVITRQFGNRLGMHTDNLTVQQQIDFVQCTFARADTWVIQGDSFPEDRPLASLREVMALGIRGYLRMAEHLPAFIRPVVQLFTSVFAGLLSLAPRGVSTLPVAHGAPLAANPPR
ncbi:UDP-forming cellulose synthase catalytic subunit [Chimaeribacter coloradensis]|uniref:Cellulose synthase catalytic subunit [UDP-forming] n=1 Tax=Chimaeribacter coloradensis TaxID=2060068 RepID=A0A2N5E1A4_9GAMM|nr:UDP-forming cellulose synthase catalytic subunit [Chimaeribacter coloradensis]PLR34105.1 UDP-forming cellulose synthase catalytic subunit [Chimaeribacter coloradensis]